MEALNHLLRADAEIRRREVAQASGGGGGGGGRQNQDLSSLFDRELQRQQQTNYENRNSATDREERPESDALRAVRELARRQDELNRRQQELAKLASRMTPEEMKRQLERLTREQSELRQQAEELARRIAQERQQGAGQGGGQQAGASADQQRLERMREISEQMQGATSDLRRQDPSRASERGSRASEQLRELARTLEGSDPGSRQRAVGELQMEAQQLADAQRRVGSEQQQLGGTRGSAEARRRLAGEQDRLADRADALQRSVSELAAGRAERDQQSVREAARELDKQAVGKQMREAAEALRQDAQQADAAKPAGERGASPDPEGIARTLDRVAERLGAARGGMDDASRRLADQLSRAQELRDRLSQLEQQIDALAREGGDRAAGETGKSPAGQNPQQGSAEAERGGQPERQPGEQPGSEGGEGRQSQQEGESSQATGQGRGRGAPGATGGNRARELSRLQAEYEQQAAELRDLTRASRQDGIGYGGTPEQHEWTGAAPGTQAFKQDYARWDDLRKGVNRSLESVEAALAGELAQRVLKDRLKAGGDDRAPEEYQLLVAKYYEALAKRKRDR
jgi:hypothetical protein